MSDDILKDSNLGRRLVLWRSVPKQYRDQFGVPHHGFQVTEEIPVRITILKQVPNVWGKGSGTGWGAEDEQGNLYTCNWHSFEDASMSPCYYWTDQRDLTQLVDSEQAFALPFGPYFGEDQQPKVPVGMGVCWEHREVGFEDSEFGSCGMCWLNKRRATR